MSVSYIIVSRNPTNRRLVVISDDNEKILEFDDEDAAFAASLTVPCCRAWGAEIVPIDRS